MAFRDDKEAAFARADALQRERDRLRAELDGANDERADLKQDLEARERELAKLRKRDAAADPERRARTAKLLAAVGAAVAGLVVVAAVFLTAATPASSPPLATHAAAPANVSAPQHPAIDHLRWCLVGADIDVRMATYESPARPDSQARGRLRECDLQLGRLATNGTVPAHLAEAVRAYTSALTAWSTRPAAAPATTRAFVVASDRLRNLAGPALVERRAELLAAARAQSATPGGAVYQEMIALADVFLDAVFASNPHRQRVEDALSAMVALAENEPSLRFEVLDDFLAAALGWVYELRATDDEVTEHWGSTALRNVMTLYYRSHLDR